MALTRIMAPSMMYSRVCAVNGLMEGNGGWKQMLNFDCLQFRFRRIRLCRMVLEMQLQRGVENL